MIDTKDTNLPEEERIAFEKTGELEESQAPESSPAEVTLEVEENIDVSASEVEPAQEMDVIPEEEIISPETATGVETEADEVSSVEEDEPVEKALSDEEDEPVDMTSSVEEDEPVDMTSSVEEDEPVDMTSPDEDDEPVDMTSSDEDDEPVDLVSFDEEEEPDDMASDTDNEPDLIKPLNATELASITKLEILERLQLINTEPKKYVHGEVDTLKQTYYKMFRIEIEAKKKAFLEGGGVEQDFVVPEDETEAQLKALIAEYKEKRASISAEEERQKETNLILKQHLIERLKILSESQDDYNKRYNEFRDIQRKWKEIKLVPQEHAKELWRSYQLYNERFYDIVKINNQFRDYDFKKNLEMKTILCETVERLAKDKDVISAFHQLQKLHQQWREIGPVSKEKRDSIWDRFKDASTLINKKHQTYYEDLKGQEEKNLEQKETICQQLESIDFENLKTVRDWEKKTDEVKGLQSKWRTIGFASRRHNLKIFERFRAACDNYFHKKVEFYKTIKKEIDKNLEMKKALVEKAESLKDSKDWKETTKTFIELQNEWKKIGSVGRKHSDILWKQFIATCDYFFEKKNKESTSQKSEEHENLAAKKALIEKIKKIDKQLSEEETLALLRGYLSEWNTIGFVPFKEKDKLHKSFKEATDKQFDRLKVNERDRRIHQFRSNLTEMTGGGKNKLYNERDKLMRTFDRMKNDLQTYENNIGFISAKGGDGLLKEMDRKIARLRQDMEVVIKKIEAIDENL